jgi:glycosyltransferase involved in cell wall biosynthesis
LLKVAVVTRYFPSSAEPSQGRSAYQTLRVLARHTNLRVFYPNASYPSLLKPGSRSYSKLDAAYSPPDVKTNYYNYPAVPVLSRPINGWMAARTLLPHIRAFAPDLIFSYFIYPEGYAALQIAKALAIPLVVEGIGSDINRIGDPISAMLTRTVLCKADFVLTVSADLRNKALAMGASPAKSRAIVNGCDHAAFHVRDRLEARRKFGIDPAAQAVVYIGRMDMKKGLRELVDAAVSLHTQRASLHVYLVGNGPDRPLIDSAIQANSAAGYIHAMPGCVFDDVAVWMAAADLVTLPSYMEGCPNVVIEALASGRPVVATNVGGIPEIMNGECGLLVPPRDSRSLAQALASVLDRTWDASVISAQCSRSWEDVAADVLEVFDSLVPAHSAKKNALRR